MHAPLQLLTTWCNCLSANICAAVGLALTWLALTCCPARRGGCCSARACRRFTCDVAFDVAAALVWWCTAVLLAVAFRNRRQLQSTTGVAIAQGALFVCSAWLCTLMHVKIKQALAAAAPPAAKSAEQQGLQQHGVFGGMGGLMA